MTGFTSIRKRLQKETKVSFRRNETCKRIPSGSSEGQVSNPYKCRRSSVASYAGMRLYRSVKLIVSI